MRKILCLLLLTFSIPGLPRAAVTNLFTASGNQINLRVPPQGDGGSGDPGRDKTFSRITVAGLPADHVILDIEATVTVTHPSAVDLVIDLTSPAGFQVLLANQRGLGGNYSGTIFDDEATVAISDGNTPFAGRFRPEALLSDFDGVSPNGTWTLGVEDSLALDTGTLGGWSLRIVSDAIRPVLSIEDATIVEGGPGMTTATLLVRMNTASPVPVTVSYGTANDTGNAGTDYVAGSGSITFNPGEVLKVVGVSILGDVQIEGTESFFVNLSNPIGGVLGDGQARVLIVDDDPTASTRTFQASGGQVNKPIPPVETGGTGDVQKDTTRSQIVVSGQPDDAVVSDLDVSISLNHAFDQDLVLRLLSPVGTTVLLSNQRGWGGTNAMAATFDDQASLPAELIVSNLSGVFRPEEPLWRMMSNRVNGTWTLEVADVGFGDTGVLSGWSMRVATIRTNALGIPALDAVLSGTNLVISWPSPSPASVVEASPSLAPAAWGGTGLTPTLINGRNSVTVPAAGPERYFRLRILQ